MKLLNVLLCLLVSVSTLPAQGMVINELLARNDTTAADQDGEYDDWIELYNNSNTAVSLHGYFLTDDNADLTKWMLPDTSIAANAFLIIWADNDDMQSGLHTNFRLSGSGETLFMLSQDTTITDQVTFWSQRSDASYGRYPNGVGDFKQMIPTFSSPNSGNEPGRETDASDILFTDSLVHSYKLEFYTDNWEDSLRINFEQLGQIFMPARLTYNNTIILDSIGVRYKGNSSYAMSRNTRKKSFKLRFDKYDNDKRLYEMERLNFNNCVNDPSFMRETIGYSIARRYIAAPRTAYAELYVEDELIGLYVVAEQIDELFIDKNFTDRNENLFKAAENGAAMIYRGNTKNDYIAEYELKTNENRDDWTSLIEMIDSLNHTPDSTFVQVISNHLDLDNIIRHLAFNMVLSHFDSYTGSGRNYYLYENDNRFTVIPWDFNEVFGVYGNNWNVITQDVFNISNINQRPLIKRILDNDSLRQRYVSYIGDMISGPASTDSVNVMIDDVYSLIGGSVQSDPNKHYNYQMFLDNIDSDVRIELGRLVPGLRSFSAARNANLTMQIYSNEVYPGDCDNNGVVNELDILPIAAYFLHEGNPRDRTSFNWGAEDALLWDNPAATFADANGDGRVDEVDVIAIGVNWGNTHENVTLSFEVFNLDNPTYRSNLKFLYSSLQGHGEAVTAMKMLLESILDLNSEMPIQYSLDQNYPNPFNPTTSIGFTLLKSGLVTLEIYDVTGRLVMTPLLLQQLNSGHHQLLLNGSGLAAGSYLYRIHSGSWSSVKSLTVVK